MQLIGIQYLRGLAALSVVIFHVAAAILGDHSEQWLSVGIFGAGVDVFFVISGFIIWKTTDRADITPLAWWRSRLIRVVPLYWLALVACLAIKQATGAHLPGTMEAMKSFLFIPTLNSKNGTMTPFLPPGWTLNYEFAFYLVMALALNLSQKWQRVLLMFAVFTSLVALRRFADPTNAIQFRMTSPLFFEFLSGILIAIVNKKISSDKVRLTIGLGAIVLAIAFIAAITPRLFPNGPRFIYFGGPAAMIVAAAVFLESHIARHVIEPLKQLGDSSYSLYLSHALIILPTLSLLGTISSHPALTGVLCVGACVVVGALCYRMVERPLLHAMNTLFAKRPKTPHASSPAG